MNITGLSGVHLTLLLLLQRHLPPQHCSASHASFQVLASSRSITISVSWRIRTHCQNYSCCFQFLNVDECEVRTQLQVSQQKGSPPAHCQQFVLKNTSSTWVLLQSLKGLIFDVDISSVCCFYASPLVVQTGVCVCVHACVSSSLIAASWARSPFCTSANRCACIAGNLCSASSGALLLGHRPTPAFLLLACLSHLEVKSTHDCILSLPFAGWNTFFSFTLL